MAAGKPDPKEVYHWLYSEFIKKYGRDNFDSDKYISIDGNSIKLVFPDPAVADFFCPPFSHIETQGFKDPDLQIQCFKAGGDFVRTAGRILPGMFNGNRRDIPFLSKKGITVTAGRESNTLSLLNRTEGKALFVFEDQVSIPDYERGSPFKAVLQWWFDSASSAMLHSASVSFDNKAVLIGGRGGAGKTSTALACRLSGMNYIGDDYVIVSGQKRFHVSGIYNSAKLTRDSLDRFSRERDRIINPGFTENEKGILFFSDPGAGMDAGPARLSAIVFPEISGLEQSSFSMISPSEGFRLMAPSTVFQHIGKRRNIGAFVSGLTKNLPCFKLSAGKDPVNLVETVKNILKGE